MTRELENPAALILNKQTQHIPRPYWKIDRGVSIGNDIQLYSMIFRFLGRVVGEPSASPLLRAYTQVLRTPVSAVWCHVDARRAMLKPPIPQNTHRGARTHDHKKAFDAQNASPPPRPQSNHHPPHSYRQVPGVTYRFLGSRSPVTGYSPPALHGNWSLLPGIW